MKLLYRNDGKGNHQSFEVFCPLLPSVQGYGHNLAEAQEAFFSALSDYRKRLIRTYDATRRGFFEAPVKA